MLLAIFVSLKGGLGNQLLNMKSFQTICAQIVGALKKKKRIKSCKIGQYVKVRNLINDDSICQMLQTRQCCIYKLKLTNRKTVKLIFPTLDL